jgi:hypothetical protein
MLCAVCSVRCACVAVVALLRCPLLRNPSRLLRNSSRRNILALPPPLWLCLCPHSVHGTPCPRGVIWSAPGAFTGRPSRPPPAGPCTRWLGRGGSLGLRRRRASSSCSCRWESQRIAMVPCVPPGGPSGIACRVCFALSAFALGHRLAVCAGSLSLLWLLLLAVRFRVSPRSVAAGPAGAGTGAGGTRCEGTHFRAAARALCALRAPP